MGGVSPETCWASYKHGIINSDTLLHLVSYFCMNFTTMHGSTNIKFTDKLIFKNVKGNIIQIVYCPLEVFNFLYRMPIYLLVHFSVPSIFVWSDVKARHVISWPWEKTINTVSPRTSLHLVLWTVCLWLFNLKSFWGPYCAILYGVSKGNYSLLWNFIIDWDRHDQLAHVAFFPVFAVCRRFVFWNMIGQGVVNVIV